jgi:uroporphyrinogen-III synthase
LEVLITARAVCIGRNTAQSLRDAGVDVSVFDNLVEFVARKILQHLAGHYHLLLRRYLPSPFNSRDIS